MMRELRAPFGGYKTRVGREGGAACEAFFTEEKLSQCPNYSLIYGGLDIRANKPKRSMQ